MVATGSTPDRPVAVLHANRVLAASPGAQAQGVTRGQRRREAQARCPELALFDHDPARAARAFEPVVAAIEQITPLIEIIRPGLCAFGTRGPSRYHGGDIAMMAIVEHAVLEVLDGLGEVRVGTADGLFAGALAARRSDHDQRLVVPGGSAAFLVPLPVSTLARPGLVDVLERLGLHTLGQFAGLPRTDVLARFGPEGATAHRLACGLEERVSGARPVDASFEVSTEIDPPVDRVDQAAFLAKTLADELHDRLDGMGLVCSLLVISAETEHGEQLERRWRHDGALSPAAIADRVRWQLDGWLSGSAAARPTGAISRLVLIPDDVRAATGHQLGFWGGRSAEGERAVRALARVQALLGPGAVVVPEWRGGRDPASQVALVPAEGVDLERPRPSAHPDWIHTPWPGRLPHPSPATVPQDPIRAEVADVRGRHVGVSGRGVLTAAPHLLAVAGEQPVAVQMWAGPWPVEERWWDSATHRRRARFQVVTVDGTARLLVLEGGRWVVEAIYD